MKYYGIPIAWYAVIITFAFLIGIILLKKDDELFNIKWEDILDLSIYVIPISIIGARLYYIIFSFDEFGWDFFKMLNIRTGGLAIYGGIIAGALTLILFSKKRNIKIVDMMDYVVPYLVLGQSIGRWGNFFNIEAYGIETTLPWRMGIYEGAKYMEVHPTFLYESIADFIIFCILIGIRENRKFSGQIVYLYLIMYSFVRFFIEGLRTDSLMFLRIQDFPGFVDNNFCSFLYYFCKKSHKKK